MGCSKSSHAGALPEKAIFRFLSGIIQSVKVDGKIEIPSSKS